MKKIWQVGLVLTLALQACVDTGARVAGPSLDQAVGNAGANRPARGALHHSDRGSQYASQAYQQILASHGLTPSMSRKGNCWDNAVAESIFATIKQDLVADTDWGTRGEAAQAIGEFIEVWYNRQRRHSSLGYQSPEQYETAMLSQALAA
jgi:transposase InsO family protein